MTFVLDKDIQFGFHRKARENVFVSQSTHRAMVVDHSRRAGIAYTARPLSGVAEFEVRLLEYAGGIRGSLKLGLMWRKANDQVPSLSMPRLSEHRDNSCVWFQSKFKEKTEFQNNFGAVHLLRYYGIVNLCDLRQDDCLGLQVSAEGDLSFFVNGVSQGVAARQVYQVGLEVYCFVELMESCKAVEITRAGKLSQKGRRLSHTGHSHVALDKVSGWPRGDIILSSLFLGSRLEFTGLYYASPPPHFTPSPSALPQPPNPLFLSIVPQTCTHSPHPNC